MECIGGHSEDHLSRVCSFKLPSSLPPDVSRSATGEMDVPDVEKYRDRGSRRFLHNSVLQKGLFADEHETFLLHLQPEFSDNEDYHDSSSSIDIRF